MFSDDALRAAAALAAAGAVDRQEHSDEKPQYVDRKDVESLLRYCVALESRDGRHMSALDILMEFNRLPGADVKPVVCGRWEGNTFDFQCSECGRWQNYITGRTNFCPNCGADMMVHRRADV